MATNTELRINLAALKRRDPYISSITDSSTHVAVYSFSPQSNEWEKTDVEGTLFVYERVAPPYWGFTIMNRLSMENLTEPLTNELEFQTQNPFLLYRNAKLLIYGIWFYDQDDCKRVGQLLEKLSRNSSNPSTTNDVNTQRISLFEKPKGAEITAKPSSPTSNSVNSISPGSSVGGVQRPQSNIDEADSESEDKEVVHSNKGIDIMDLLCKAQDKYEKEKRNTPDPVSEGMQNGMIMSPIDTAIPLVKPVPVKPSHPQKLDVASLFKTQAPKMSNMATAKTNASENQNSSTPSSAILPQTTPYPGMMIQQKMVPIPQPTANVNIPQPQGRSRIVRSFSMNEMAMRQQVGINLDSYMNGGVMSVEEVEANLSKTSVTSRQQQLNSRLDKLIDRINSSGGLTAPAPQPPHLPGIQENISHYPAPKTSTGNSGSMVVNGNSLYSGDDTFPSVEMQRHIPTTNVKFPSSSKTSIRQRSVSTSGLQQVQPGQFGPTLPVSISMNSPSFPIMPNPNSATAMTLSYLPGNIQPKRNEPGLLLHGNVVNTEQPTVTLSNPNLTMSSVTAASTVHVADKKKVQLNNSISSSSSTNSPAIATTLISPEDFERSASTPQKKLELKQRLLQEIQPITHNPTATQTPLTREQLQQTLVTLLKDPTFLASIHEAYMTNFKRS